MSQDGANRVPEEPSRTPDPGNPRVRFLYAKRGPACFLSHADLPVLFGRAARRGGLTVSLTQGFSPHPKVSLGPPLPVGVVGLEEPLEVWFEDWDPCGFRRFADALPPGFSLVGAQEVRGPSLASRCRAGSYDLFLREGTDPEAALEGLRGWEEGAPALRELRRREDRISLVLLEPDRYGPSHLVRVLVAAGVLGSWGDLLVVRRRIGDWEEGTGRVLPLMEPGPQAPEEVSS